MSLNVYVKMDEIPEGMKVIRCNDAFFKGVDLQDDYVTNEILKYLDKARYGSACTFIDRNPDIGHLNKECLSTGCKTLLNVYYTPDVCFDFIECTYNVQEIIYLIRQGNVYIEYPTLSYSSKNHSCDIAYRGKRYTDFNEFKIQIIGDLGGDNNDYEYHE